MCLQCVKEAQEQPRSIMHGRKRSFSIVFDPFHINRITAIFCRIVSECKRSDTAFSHRIRLFSTVYDTVKYGRNTGPYKTGQIRAVYDHKRQYTRWISAYTVIGFIDLGISPSQIHLVKVVNERQQRMKIEIYHDYVRKIEPNLVKYYYLH